MPRLNIFLTIFYCVRVIGIEFVTKHRLASLSSSRHVEIAHHVGFPFSSGFLCFELNVKSEARVQDMKEEGSKITNQRCKGASLKCAEEEEEKESLLLHSRPFLLP